MVLGVGTLRFGARCEWWSLVDVGMQDRVREYHTGVGVLVRVSWLEGEQVMATKLVSPGRV
jgi:hypothetical protein